MILPGLVLPVVVAVVSVHFRLRSPVWVVGLCLAQSAQLAGDLATYQSSWYHEVQIKEIRAMVDWVEDHVPEGEPIASDFLNSTAILAGTGIQIIPPATELVPPVSAVYRPLRAAGERGSKAHAHFDRTRGTH